MEINQLYELYLTTSGVCTDTRRIESDCMFFALKGDNFDGNEFAEMALESGAKFVIVDNKDVFSRWKDSVGKIIDNEEVVSIGGVKERAHSMILVDNVLTTMQHLARYHRRKFRVPVIALTGTNGKTTTKELIYTALSTTYKVIATQGNLNNHIGVPLTLFRIDSQTQVVVIEMGASGPGEIETLCEIACPSFGLITNVGKAHLLGFGSFEGVIKTKGELYDSIFKHRKIAFVNVGNEHLSKMVKDRSGMQIVPYGLKNDGAEIIRKPSSPFLSIVINNPSLEAVKANEPAKIEVNTKLIGDYNADNILAALCVATYFAVPTMAAVKAIENYNPTNNRSQMVKTKRNDLIVDAYNANPTSMRAALENLSKIIADKKSIILGDMLELGVDSLAEHCDVLRFAAYMLPYKIFLVGTEFAAALQVVFGGANENIICFNDSEQLAKYLKNNNFAGGLILIKGSRGTHLERVLESL